MVIQKGREKDRINYPAIVHQIFKLFLFINTDAKVLKLPAKSKIRMYSLVYSSWQNLRNESLINKI